MSYTTVTIIIPTYNRRSLLEHAVTSVFVQSYPSIQLIITDNNSLDDTQSYCEALVPPSNINYLYLRQKTLVPPEQNFYSALKHAMGDFIGFLGDDDTIQPSYVSKLVCYLQANPMCVHVGSQALEISPAGTLIRHEDYSSVISDSPTNTILSSLFDFTLNSRLAILFYGLTRSSVLLQSLPLKRFSLFCGRTTLTGTEIVFFSRLYRYGSIHVFPEPLYCYTGPGARDGQPSLASQLSKHHFFLDSLSILYGQTSCLLETILTSPALAHRMRISLILLLGKSLIRSCFVRLSANYRRTKR